MAKNIRLRQNLGRFGIRDTATPNIIAFRKELNEIVGKALFAGAEELMAEIKETPLVPVDTGLLRESGFVGLPEEDEAGVGVTMGFGSHEVEYAAAIHEGFHTDARTGALVQYNQPYKIGQIKYLEEPVSRSGRDFAAKILRAIRHFVKGLPK